MKSIRTALITIGLFCLTSSGPGQQTTLTPGQIKAYGDSIIGSLSTTPPNSPQTAKHATIFLEDSNAKEIISQYNEYALMQYKRAFSWQFYSSIIIFIIVIGIVLMGLYMAYQQFLLAHKIILKEAERVPTIETPVQPFDIKLIDTDMQISDKGIKINTAVIGVIILLLSLGFFFLYLKYVYQIVLIKPL